MTNLSILFYTLKTSLLGLSYGIVLSNLQKLPKLELDGSLAKMNLSLIKTSINSLMNVKEGLGLRFVTTGRRTDGYGWMLFMLGFHCFNKICCHFLLINILMMCFFGRVILGVTSLFHHPIKRLLLRSATQYGLNFGIKFLFLKLTCFFGLLLKTRFLLLIIWPIEVSFFLTGVTYVRKRKNWWITCLSIVPSLGKSGVYSG